MDKATKRLEKSMNRIKDAGFTQIERIKGIDGRSVELLDAWENHGNPRFDPSDGWFNDPQEHPHKQGTLVSHMNIWKCMIDNNIPFATIFEDDIVFHKDWKQLAPAYYQATPKDYDVCYMGHHCGCGINKHILRTPVYCTHAYILTLEGAKIIYNKMLNDPNGVRTIDCLLNYYMQVAMKHPDSYCNWYAWNAEMFPDPTAKKHPDHVRKDQGLVFQEYEESPFSN